MGSIEKLRELARKFGYFNPSIESCIDEIEHEIAERYMLLPVDADGVPIHIGDVMDVLKDGAIVRGVGENSFESSWCRYENAASYRHVKPRTIEDVLRDVMKETRLADMTNDEVVTQYADAIRELTGGE